MLPLARYAHLQSLLFDEPHAVTAARLSQVVHIIGPRLLGEPAVMQAMPNVDDDEGATTFDPARVPVNGEGVAVVPIRGTFVPRAGAFSAMSGMVSYAQVAGLIQGVAARDDVRGLVLDFDSPGGAIAGVTEAAAAIAAITKPVYAAANYTMASAAYWLAASASRIFVPDTGAVGSIGVIAVRLDATKQESAAGRAWTFIASGARKTDGDPRVALRADERDALQARVDEAAEMFFAHVAERRGLDATAVAALEAGIFGGKDAVTHGLADVMGTVADAVRVMGEAINPTAGRLSRGRGRMTGTTTAAEVAATLAAETPPDPPVTDVPAEAPADEPEAPADAEARGRQAGLGDAQQIAALCVIAQRRELCAEYLAAGLTVAQVQAKLQALAVGAEAPGITSHPDGSTGAAGPNGTRLNVNELMRAHRQQAIAYRGGEGR